MRTKAWALLSLVVAVGGCYASSARYAPETCLKADSSTGYSRDPAGSGAPADEELLVLEARATDSAGPQGGDRPTQGTLRARNQKGEELGELPLRHTDVAGEVTGFLASTKVTQTFENHSKEPIEAVYIFPLPETAAVNDFLMVVGERRIRGVVRPRAEAEKIYRDARARGYTASLLTQERPNIFTQNVANIASHSQVKIEITYFHTLRYEAGEYEWAFPMVVGPRFCPPGKVADEGAISPPVLAEGQRSGHDISLSVTIDAGVPLGGVTVPTHACTLERLSETRARITLEKKDSIPNRDLVLRYKVAGEKPSAGILAHRGGGGAEAVGGAAGGRRERPPANQESGFFTLMVNPQLDPRDADVTPREITFLIDISGSQMGQPLDMSKEIVLRCLDKLRPDDRFNVMYFESGSGQLFDAPSLRTKKNIEKAKDFVASLSGGGGTNMLEGLRRALHQKRDPKYLGMVVFFTDGYIGNDAEILRMVKQEHGSTRVFVFGTGPSVNRALLSGIAENGDGKVAYAIPRDQGYANRCVNSFFSAIDAPVLCDISVDYGSLEVKDVYPRKVNDLFTGQPVVLTGRYAQGGEGVVTIRGRVGARRVEIPVQVRLPARQPEHAALAPVWARARIADLTDQQLTADGEGSQVLARQITDLACEFRLVSQYTSFVAVDESERVSDGQPAKIVQPVELPEGLSREGLGVGGQRSQ